MQPNPIPLSDPGQEPAWQILGEFSLPSQPGSDRLARERVAVMLQPLSLSPANLERLKTAVAEATLNAIEHGHGSQPDRPGVIRILAVAKTVPGPITDQDRGPISKTLSPDQVATLPGPQSPRAWGFFLIEKTGDNLWRRGDEAHQTIELFLYFEGDRPAGG